MKSSTVTSLPRALWMGYLEQAGIHPLLARLYAARGMASADELDDSLARLPPPSPLTHADAAAACVLTDALTQGTPVCIVADYDCDGATALRRGLRGLRMLEAALATHGNAPPARPHQLPGARLRDRRLWPDPAWHCAWPPPGAKLLVTVDNGIASVEGDADCPRAGHAGAGHRPPPARHPQRPGGAACRLHHRQPQPALRLREQGHCRVGVMFYVLLALQAELRNRASSI